MLKRGFNLFLVFLTSAASITAVLGNDMQNRDVECLATALMSEASIGTYEERVAVAWTIFNRVDSSEFPNSICDVIYQRSQYATNQEPDQELFDLAKSLIANPGTDPTGGALYFFSPRSMPKEGADTSRHDVGGGLHEVEGISGKVYFPSFSSTKEYVGDLQGVRPAYYMFYRNPNSVSQTRPNVAGQLDTIREAIYRARYGQQQSDLASTEVMSIGFPVTLTLYVHEGDVNGPTIPGVLVTGQDGAGHGFEQTTDNSGYVTITGISGTWSFSASADGYETNSWSQPITETDTKDAFLKEVQSSVNSVVGKWAYHFKMEKFESSTEKVWLDPDSPDEWDGIIEFYQDGTFLDSPLSENSVTTTGEWSQNGNAISFYGTGNSKDTEGDYSEEFTDSLNGLIEENIISGTGIIVSSGKFCETQYETYCENWVTVDTSMTYSWTASRI